MASMANLLMYSRGQEGFAPNQWRDLHSFSLECAPSALCFDENIHLCFARPPNFPRHLTTKKEERIWKKKKTQKTNRGVQWSILLPVPSLLHVHHRKSVTASVLLLRCLCSSIYSLFGIEEFTDTEMTEQWCKVGLSFYIWGERVKIQQGGKK